MCNETRCSSWISLHSLGIPTEGCLRNSAWVSSIVLRSSQMGHCYINLPYQRLLCMESIAQGQFGTIDLAVYQVGDKKKEVYVKRPILQENLLVEACIQKLVGDSLKTVGFPLGAPPLVSIFALDNGSVCFAMDMIPGAITLDRFLHGIKPMNMDAIIIDCLLQLCAMLSHLHYVLGINHRDVKPSNFLIVEHEPRDKNLVIDGTLITIVSRYSLTMIDFGFACLGTGKKTDVALSTVYPPMDVCLKDGRDMFLFLGLLYLDIHTKLSPSLCRLFESWIDVMLCAFMRKNKEYSMQWLYFMAGNESILKFQSNPSRILRDLQAL
jgi:serine/threonine protein kinase